MGRWPLKVMILAAGLGKRMLPLTAHRPKPLLEVAGKPLIVHHLEKLQRAGYREVVMNIGHLGEQISALLGNGQQFGLSIEYSREEALLETAGGIIKALPVLGDGPFLVVNADLWCDLPLGNLSKHSDYLAHLYLVDNPVHHPRGDFFLDFTQPLADMRDSFVVTDTDDKTAPQGAYTYSGISILEPALFDGYEPGVRALAPVLRRAITGNAVSATLYRGKWQDVGTPQRLNELNAWLSSQGTG